MNIISLLKNNIFFLILLSTISFNSYSQNGLYFDGTDDYISTNQGTIAGDASRTYEAWVKIPFVVGTAQRVIIDMGTMSTGQRFTMNLISGNFLRIEVGGSGISGTTDISDNTWHHVAVTYNPTNPTGTKAKMYIDGVLETSGDFTVAVNTATTGNIVIGRRNDAINYFEGTMDEVRVWNVERTAAQILAEKDNEFCTIPSGLIAYYKLNEGIAGGVNTGLDTIYNEITPYIGTLNNFTLSGSTSNWVTGATLTSGIVTSSLSDTSCSSYLSPAGNTYTATGIYYDTLTSVSGCDSIITINLTIGAPSVTGLTATTIDTSSATLVWNAITGISEYEYEITTTSAPPSGSGAVIGDTLYNASLLTPGTTYYIHVRINCEGTYSAWTTYSFTTNCNAPPILSYDSGYSCGAGTTILYASTTSGASINWYTTASGGSPFYTGDTFYTPYITSSTYFYITADDGICESNPRQAVLAEFRDVPFINLGIDTIICPNSAITLNAGNPTSSYLWSNGATTQTIDISSAGTYWVNITLNACSGSDTIVISDGIIATDALSDTTNLCFGDTVTLDALNPGFAYSWSPTVAYTQTIDVFTEDNYYVDITSSDGCVYADSTYLKLRPLPIVNLGNDTAICSNDSIQLDAANTGFTYLWNTLESSQIITTTDSGMYYVTVTSNYGCDNSDTIIVAFNDEPTTDGFDYIERYELGFGVVDFAAINPMFVDIYEWDFGDGSPISNEEFPQHTFTSIDTYTVTLTVYNGCDTTSQSINIYIDDIANSINNTNDIKNILSIYPNPTNNGFFINKQSSFINEEFIISIYDVLGKEIKRTNIDAANDNLFISTISWNKGIYFIKIKGEDNNTQQFKLIVQ